MKRIIALLAVFTLLVAGCSSNKDTNGSKEDTGKSTNSTLVIGLDGDPGNNINPLVAGNRYDLTATKAIFNPLFDVVDGKEVFYLAESYEANETNTEYTFKLREGVKFHDGEKFDADDVVFTFNEMITNPIGVQYDVLQFNGNPVKVEKVDDYTVKFIMVEAKPNLLESITDVFIMPEHIYSKVTDYSTNVDKINPVGTASYKYEKYASGESLTLKANKDYYLVTPKIETVVYRIFTDVDAATIALEKGEVNSLAIDASMVSRFEKKEFNITAYSEGRVGYIAFNLNSKLGNDFSNADYRKGVFKAINKDDLLKTTYTSKDFAADAFSFLPSTATFVTDDTEHFDYNVEEAKALVKDKGSNKLVFAYQNSVAANGTIATLVQSYLKEVGIDVELKPLDPNALNKALNEKTGEFDLYISGYILGGDPSNYSVMFETDGLYNFSGYSNPEVDALFKLGGTQIKDSDREKTYVELQQKFIKDAYFYPVTENLRIFATSKNLKGLDEAKLVPIYGYEDMAYLYFD